MMPGLRIVFAGTPEFGLPCLEALAASKHRIAAVYTQPDRPAGRGRKLQPSVVKSWAMAHDIPIYQPLNFKSSESVEALASLKPDLMVVIAYGLLLPASILNIPKWGCINVHASLLPRWRGASPIQQALLHGDTTTGVTIMQMDVGLDTGDSLAQASCTIVPRETAASLHDKLAQLAPDALLRTLDDIASSQAQALPQNNDQAVYAAKINKADAQVDWHQPAEAIDRLIRAFNPWPIAYTLLNGEPLRIHQAHVEEGESKATPGTILAIEKKGLLVATGFGMLRIDSLQFPGGKVMAVSDWMNAGRWQHMINAILQ